MGEAHLRFIPEGSGLGIFRASNAPCRPVDPRWCGVEHLVEMILQAQSGVSPWVRG